jgi:hypothetical protein
MNAATRLILSVLVLSLGGLAPVLALGQPAASGASSTADTDPIKPSSVMGDKDRSGPDGWVQAPVTRDAAPAQKAKAAGEPATQSAKATPASAKPMPAGEDPGTPMAPTTGPGALSTAPKPASAGK